MVCTQKYKKCYCKLCKRKTRLRAKPCEKSVLDKCNNGIKRLFKEDFAKDFAKQNLNHKEDLQNLCQKCGSEYIFTDDHKVCVKCGLWVQLDSTIDYSICQNCGSKDILIDFTNYQKVCENCGLCEQIYSTDFANQNLITYDDEIRRSIKYYDGKVLEFKGYMNIFQGNLSGITSDLIDKVKQKLPKGLAMQDLCKKDVLKVLKSDSELKHNSHAVHAIYYEITGNHPIDFTNDWFDMVSDVEKLLKFYWKIKPRDKRNYFNYRYVLYHLLKQRNYPVTLEDFPEMRDISNTKKLCEDFANQNLQKSVNQIAHT